VNGDLAGIFDPRGSTGTTRLRTVLGAGAVVIESGPMRIALEGSPRHGPGPLCLLDGFLDDLPDLRRSLGLPQQASEHDVLAAGYLRWGHLLPARLRGDFGLVIWDRAAERGLIARDQLGVRCLYLHERGASLYFASELHVLLALLPGSPAPDEAGLAHWLAASNRPGSHTLYAGVRRLDPGTVLVLTRDGVAEHGYWRPRYREPSAGDGAELVAEVRSALTRSVSRRMAAHERVDVLMSGGLDSGSVAALAAHSAPGRVHAHSGVFPEHPAVDESELIELLRSELRLPGLTAEVRAGGLLASALEHSRRWRLPLLGWGDFWTLPLLRLAASRGAEITLGGDGGDELFGPRSYLLADSLLAGRPREALSLALELPGAGEHPPRREVARVLARWGAGGVLSHGPRTALWKALARRGLPRWLRPAQARLLVGSDDPHAWRRLDGPRWWAHAAHGLTRGVEETGVFEHQRLRGRMAGLQARHPLFDLDLLELALSVDPRASLDRDRNRPLLRSAMAGLLPDAVRLRPGKAWFDSLIRDCLTGPDREAVRALLGGDSEIGAYVRRAKVLRMLDAGPGAGAEGFLWMHQVWRLLTAECWLRVQAGRSVTVAASPPRMVVRPHGDSSVFPS
jgi:asparagine synthase (glutamine-hydrolysing)